MSASAINTVTRDEYPGDTHTILQQFTHRTAECKTADSVRARAKQVCMALCVHRPKKKDVDIVKAILLMRECMSRHVMMLGFLTAGRRSESFSALNRQRSRTVGEKTMSSWMYKNE